jgi:hypothetical protein
MSKTYKIAELDGVDALVVLQGAWRDEYLAVIESERLAGLSVGVPPDGNLGFLRDLTHLRVLVLNADRIESYAPLEGLASLETLTLNTPARPRRELDFGAFGVLRKLGLYWNPGFASALACSQLEEVYVFSPPDPDLTRFGRLVSLRRLELSQGRRLSALQGVEILGELRFSACIRKRGWRTCPAWGGSLTWKRCLSRTASAFVGSTS